MCGKACVYDGDKMEPAEGFEPPTSGLQNRCATTTLYRLFAWTHNIPNTADFCKPFYAAIQKSSSMSQSGSSKTRVSMDTGVNARVRFAPKWLKNAALKSSIRRT